LEIFCAAANHIFRTAGDPYWMGRVAGVWKEQMQSGALKLRRCYFRSHQKKEAALPEAA
jgi:hypothetical protein